MQLTSAVQVCAQHVNSGGSIVHLPKVGPGWAIGPSG